MIYHVKPGDELPKVIYKQDRNKSKEWREVLIEADKYGALGVLIDAVKDAEEGLRVFVHLENAKKLAKQDVVLFGSYLQLFLRMGGVLVLYSDADCKLLKQIRKYKDAA